MSRKTVPPRAGSAKARLQYRPANAMNTGVTSRSSWSKAGGKRGANPRSAKPKRGPSAK